MTDKVDALMEDMVQELNHYRNENYFTEEEIRDIVRERRQSELVICVSPHSKYILNQWRTYIELL